MRHRGFNTYISAAAVQRQTSPMEAENYWLQCIHQWYPEIQSQTYFLPPLHFNRVPYQVEMISKKHVLVPAVVQGGGNRQSRDLQATNSILTTRSRHQSNFDVINVQESDVRDDRALQHVLYNLRALADSSRPQEVMVVISQLQFGKYLHKPCYAAAVECLPRIKTLPRAEMRRGDFDILIIHKRIGLVTLEIKSVGGNFRDLKTSEEQQMASLHKKVKETVRALDKSEVVLRHLVSDLSELEAVKIIKVPVLPNLSSSQLVRVVESDPRLVLDLCKCLGVQNVEDAVRLCLLSDQLSDKDTFWNMTSSVLVSLRAWWQLLVETSGPKEAIPPTMYERLVARFCGPATTVEIHCVTAPRLQIRVPGEAVSETGERMVRLVLFPQQIELLHSSPPRVFLSGPPGTGKTIVLIMQGLTWLQRGHDVHVVSMWFASRAASFLIEHQLQETCKETSPWLDARVHRHDYDLDLDEDVNSAVKRLEAKSSGRQLCVITDETQTCSHRFAQFCERLVKRVPAAYLWGAAVYQTVRPSCLDEVTLTVSLRSPPVVVREVKQAREIVTGRVQDYTPSDVPDTTDGPTVKRITHCDGQSGHTHIWPLDCVQCGREVARVLRELNVGEISVYNGTPPLQYRDVVVLCYRYPTGDRGNESGQGISRAMSLVQGMRACHVPVRVVDRHNDVISVRDTALALRNEVTVIRWDDVRGLERKVVVAGNYKAMGSSDNYVYHRLYSASRCSSQLVWIDF